ncbi:MAG: hypothetical protein A2536_04670 [Candidatus Firestonebacteria bacterium RIFOXYD2_FULL_39_29]|nr:MAG: hypothetical protein A2536_04670 [Candidatus Firestonebacteria bacterium RIFOXYD2_FULL_39_29]
MSTKVEILKRIKSGIPGLDEMCDGGFIQGTITLVAGHFGTDKKLFGLQYLKEGLNNGEKCIYISFVENPLSTLKFYAILKTDWESYINKGSLIVFPANIFKIDTLLVSLKKVFSREKIMRVFIDEMPVSFVKRIKISEKINKIFKTLKKYGISTFFTATISKKEEALFSGNIPFLKLIDNIMILRGLELTTLKVKESVIDTKTKEIRMTKEGLGLCDTRNESDKIKIPNVISTADLAYHIAQFSPEEERMNKIVKEFELKNPNINVNRVESDKQTDIREFYVNSKFNFEGILRKYMAKQDITLGLVCLPYNKVYEYASQGLLMNLDSFIKTTDYLEESIESCSFNNKIYGVPFTVGCRGMMYRKDLLEKYKIKVPETWDELMDAAQYILDKENDPALTGVSYQLEGKAEIVSMLLGFVWGNNGDIFDSKSNIITDKKIISALKYMKKVIFTYKVIPEDDRFFPTKDAENFYLKKSIFLMARTDLVEIAFGWDKTPLGNNMDSIKGNVWVAPMPKMEKSSKRCGLAYGSALCIPKNTKSPKSAILFLEYLISEEISKKIALINWPFPPRISLWEDKEILSKRPYYTSAEKILKDCRGINKEIINCPEIKYLIKEKTLQIMYENKKPEEEWITLSKNIKELLRRHSIYRKTVERVVSYTEKKYRNKEFYEGLLAEMKLSPHYLQRIFKVETGMTILDYLLEIRMEKAKELLKNVKYNISDVAQKVGYSDFAYFCKMFKKYTKYTPTEYRTKY